MANVYIEPRPKGREGPIEDYVVEGSRRQRAGHVQNPGRGIKWAFSYGHTPLVARVQTLNDKKKPNHCRSA